MTISTARSPAGSIVGGSLARQEPIRQSGRKTFRAFACEVTAVLVVGCCVSVIGCSDPAAALLRDLESSEASVRSAAARRLGETPIAEERVVNALTARLRDDESEVRRLAAYAIGQTGGDVSLAQSELKAALNDPSLPVRLTAAYAMVSKFPTDEAPVAVLAKAAKDGDPRAIVALGQLGPAARASVPDLRAALGNSSTLVRVKAIETLNKIGRDNKDVQAALQSAQSDPTPEVQSALRQLK